MDIDETTDPESLVGKTYTTQHFDDPFTVRSASQAPELKALGYGARTEPTNLHDGYTFLAFAPWGSQMKEHGTEGS